MRSKLTLITLAFGIALGAAALFAIMRPRSDSARVNLSHAAVVTRMQSLGRLESSSFTIEKVIEASKPGSNAVTNFLFGEKLLLVAHGEVVAGFNLANLAADDITIDGTTLSVRLPAPQILVSRLDNEKTKVYDRDSGLLSRPDKDLESDARLAAEQSIRASACESGILGQASANARKQIEALFTAIGFTQVTVTAADSGTCG